MKFLSMKASHAMLALGLLLSSSAMVANCDHTCKTRCSTEQSAREDNATLEQKLHKLRSLRLRSDDENLLDWMSDHKLFVLGLTLGIFNYDDVIEFAQTHPVSSLILGYLFLSMTL